MKEQTPVVEFERIQSERTNGPWRLWGPYLSERQWGTVREDYSENGDSWNYISHDKARYNAYRWGEEGIGGISDNKQRICLSWTFWNHNDPILKERLFGLANHEGNHGEDVKEMYVHSDNMPSHAYMQYKYTYPVQAFPYSELVLKNRGRSKQEDEYELADTGVLDQGVFNVEIEYFKMDTDNIGAKISVSHNTNETQKLYAMPTLWLRNVWSGGRNDASLFRLQKRDSHSIEISHCDLKGYQLYANEDCQWVFTKNETNLEVVHGVKTKSTGQTKEGIEQWLIHKNSKAANLESGTKCMGLNHFVIKPGEVATALFQLGTDKKRKTRKELEQVLVQRQQEKDQFFDYLTAGLDEQGEKDMYKAAISGLLWNKQFYSFNLYRWLKGDIESQIKPKRKYFRNQDWQHLDNSNILSVPDKWEYPWYAAWDLALQVIPLARVDPMFAKRQIELLLREYYMHPNGQIPAYEWNFSDVNPPVHALAAWEIYQIDKGVTGKGDKKFLERVFQKLLLNFTWWVNQKGTNQKNVFEGGFLGLDNIGIFDRSNPPEEVEEMLQSDATSWMAMYALNMMRIALELADSDHGYEEMASKFFQHFMFIGGSMADMGDEQGGLWNEPEGFYYDLVRTKSGQVKQLPVRSIVGLIPLLAVEVFDKELIEKRPLFIKRAGGFVKSRPDLKHMLSIIIGGDRQDQHLISIVRSYRLYRILQRMLDDTEFLSDFGIRSLSKSHESAPVNVGLDKNQYHIKYEANESSTTMFGGNSNWRGPIWMPINYMLIQALKKYDKYYHDKHTYEFPTGSGNQLTLDQVANELSERLKNMLLKAKEPEGYTFYEYFGGDDGRPLGASHQAGWTALIAELMLDSDG